MRCIVGWEVWVFGAGKASQFPQPGKLGSLRICHPKVGLKSGLHWIVGSKARVLARKRSAVSDLQGVSERIYSSSRSGMYNFSCC